MKLLPLMVVISILFILIEIWAVFWGRKKLGFLFSQIIAISCSVVIPIAFLLICLLCSSLFTEQVIEENPIVDPQRLSGQYIYQNQTLTISYEAQPVKTEPFYISQGSYSKVNSQFTESGKWNLIDSNLTLISSQGMETHIKITELKNAYQLLVVEKLHQDPDEWDWQKVWNKANH